VLAVAGIAPMLLRLRAGEVEPQSAASVSFGAVFGGLVGAFYAVRLSDQLLFIIYGIVLSALGLTILWRRPEPTIGS
jgi:uncharacterized membrane protein YfcA